MNQWAISEWKDGDLLNSNGLTGLLGGRYVLIPGNEVTPELAADALKRWYHERFEFKRRHWTHLTGMQPTIILDLHWTDGDDGGGPPS